MSTLLRGCPHYWEDVHIIERMSTLLRECPHYWEDVHIIERMSTLLRECPHYWEDVHIIERMSTLLRECPCLISYIVSHTRCLFVVCVWGGGGGREVCERVSGFCELGLYWSRTTPSSWTNLYNSFLECFITFWVWGEREVGALKIVEVLNQSQGLAEATTRLSRSNHKVRAEATARLSRSTHKVQAEATTRLSRSNHKARAEETTRMSRSNHKARVEATTRPE